MKKNVLIGALGVILMGASLNASAVLIPAGNFPVTIQLTPLCAVNTSVTGMTATFGTHAVGTANVTGLAVGTMVTTCSAGTIYTIGFNAGNAGNWGIVTPATRHMKDVLGTANYVAYDLFANANPVGDLAMADPTYSPTTIGGANAISYVGTGAADNTVITAAAYTAASTYAASYADTVTVTVAY